MGKNQEKEKERKIFREKRRKSILKEAKFLKKWDGINE